MRCEKGFRAASPAGRLSVISAAILMGAAPAWADRIVAVTNARGQIVYVNTNTPGPAKSPAQTQEAAGRDPEVSRIDHLADQIAGRHRVDPNLVHAVIRVESDYNPTAVSDKGAMGLMQLIPETAARLGVGNPFNPRQNIEGGVTYLKYLLKRFHGSVPLALAAYNAGQNSVIRWGGIPPIDETQAYVQKVTELYRPGPPARTRTGESPQASTAPILRYVDAEGVVHFTNTQ